MAKKKALYDENGKLIIPDTLTGVTKEFMLLYLEEYGTVEDIEWYSNILETTEKKVYKTPINGEIEEPDRKLVRKEFIQHFEALKNLDPEKRNKDKKVSLEDRLKKLREKKLAESK